MLITSVRPDTSPGMKSNYLLGAYPREGWARHPDLGGLGRFWLHKHDSFRSLGGRLKELGSDFLDDKEDVQETHSKLLYPLNEYISNLHGHHSIEDQHYFPLFKRVEPRLKKGFTLLEGDHDVVHETITRIVDDWQRIAKRKDDPQFDTKAKTTELIGTIRGFIDNVDTHLTDEEDLVIPLLIKHKDRPL